MSKLPKKISDRLNSEIKKYQKILTEAKNRDANESDTVTIITDMLSDVFGYDKYSEITSEQQIRGTFCDLAVEVCGKTEFLLEAKAIGQELNDHHLRQAINYGAGKAIKWVILTNGLIWQIHRIKDQLPLDHEKVMEFNMIEINPRTQDDQEKLFLICKEGIQKSAIESFHKRASAINKYVVGAILVSSPVVNLVRKEIRKIAGGIKVTPEEIENIIKNEVVKQIIVDSDSASTASKIVKKSQKKAA